jgi:ribosome recycling factor
MTNDYDKHLQSELDITVERLKQDLAALRSSRASVELVEKISLIHYGQPMTIQQLGSLAIEAPRTVVITLWDQTAVAPVVKAIQDAQVGLSVTNDGMTVRASMAALTSERRDELTKTVKKTAEASRIAIRNQRDDSMKKVRAAKDAKEITEDDERSIKDALQGIVDRANKKVDALVDAKLESIAE